jgi:hypothetical protein
MTNCSFPAEALIREMRRVCADADAVNDLATISKASRYARRTIELRKDHEEMYNGCPLLAGSAEESSRKKSRTN